MHVTDGLRHGFHIQDGICELNSCTACGCAANGVICIGRLSRAELQGCILKGNVACGVCAQDDAVVEVSQSSSSGNGIAGYNAETEGRMFLRNSSSDGDTQGCLIAEGWELIMHQVTIDSVVQYGELP